MTALSQALYEGGRSLVLLRMLSFLHLQGLWGPRAFLSATVGLQPLPPPLLPLLLPGKPSWDFSLLSSLNFFFLLKCLALAPSLHQTSSIPALARARQIYQDAGPVGCWCPKSSRIYSGSFLSGPMQLFLLVTHACPLLATGMASPLYQAQTLL